jgi:hypothetical protein
MSFKLVILLVTLSLFIGSSVLAITVSHSIEFSQNDILLTQDSCFYRVLMEECETRIFEPGEPELPLKLAKIGSVALNGSICL